MPRLPPVGEGANVMLALKGLVMSLRLPDPFDWRANQAIAACVIVPQTDWINSMAARLPEWRHPTRDRYG